VCNIRISEGIPECITVDYAMETDKVLTKSVKEYKMILKV